MKERKGKYKVHHPSHSHPEQKERKKGRNRKRARYETKGSGSDLCVYIFVNVSRVGQTLMDRSCMRTRSLSLSLFLQNIKRGEGKAASERSLLLRPTSNSEKERWIDG